MMVPRKVNSSLTRKSTGTHLNALRGAHPAFCKPDCFFTGEDLATESVPRCGGCKCGKCPIPGHSLSFKEEQELHMIRSNLNYDASQKIWTTSYPWLMDPNHLPNNYSSALATLKSTERSLEKDVQWADSYTAQIEDMLRSVLTGF